MTGNLIVQSYRGILGGEPVFVGTRVPVRFLDEYQAAGLGVEAFLKDFPAASREQVEGFLALPPEWKDRIDAHPAG